MLVVINAVYVRETRRTVEELRQARFVEVLPMLRWQQPRATLWPDAPGRMSGRIEALLTNEGPGPARILTVEIESSREPERWRPVKLVIPSTVGPGVRLDPFAARADAIDPGEARIAIRVRYGDLLGEFEYVTRVTLAVTFRVPETDDFGQPVGPESGVEFIDSDERSALDRRVLKLKMR